MSFKSFKYRPLPGKITNLIQPMSLHSSTEFAHFSTEMNQLNQLRTATKSQLTLKESDPSIRQDSHSESTGHSVGDSIITRPISPEVFK